MTNFIFKSQETYKKLANNIEVLLNEQRHQRMDLASLLRKMDTILKHLDLEKRLSASLDEYYETQDQHGPEDEDETSHQTDQDNKNVNG